MKKRRHSNYNPLFVYDKKLELESNEIQQTTLEEAIAKHHEMLADWETRESRLGSWYKTKTTKSGIMLESEIYLSFNRRDYTYSKIHQL